MTWMCVVILTEGHLDNFTGRKMAKSGPGQYLSYGETLAVFTSNEDCLWPGDLSFVDPRSFGQIKGHWQKTHNSCLET